MIVLCVVTFLAILLEYYFTRERVTEENMKLAIKEEKLPMMKQLKACVSNGYWWIIILYFAVPVWRSGKERFHELLLPLDV